MALPDFSMRQLLEAGVHFGHQKHRWNPKMASYIYGVRNNIHIIDLAQTVPMLYRALQVVSDTVANGGRILFVGTKRQAKDSVLFEAFSLERTTRSSSSSHHSTITSMVSPTAAVILPSSSLNSLIRICPSDL